MNTSILTAIESLCDDIATNVNPDDNQKRATAALALALVGTLTPEEYSDEYEDEYEKDKQTAKEDATKAILPSPGEHFEYNGIEFVALGEEQGGVLAVTAHELEEEMAYDENNCNDWRKSTLRKYLNGEYLKKFNKGDLLPIVSDLTADNGMDDYGTAEDYIALLSDNLYRKYRKVMPKYDNWVWTITPWSCTPGDASYERFVLTSGVLSSDVAYDSFGVAPACIFNRSIFE